MKRTFHTLLPLLFLIAALMLLASCQSGDGPDDTTVVTTAPATAAPLHKPVSEWTSENGTHYHACADGCGMRHSVAACSGGTATCESPALCGVCGAAYGEPHHTYEERRCTLCRAWEPSENLSYALLPDGTYAICGRGCCLDTVLVIPERHNGKPVTVIGQGAFLYDRDTTDFVLPPTITRIEDFAFPPTREVVLHIRDLAAWCRVTIERSSAGLQLYLNDEPLTDLVIPEGITSISPYLFSGCSSFSSISLPSTLTSLGYGNLPPQGSYPCTTYEGATYLGNAESPYTVLVAADKTATTITVHKDTKVIYAEAFLDCTMLSSITLPDTITEIGDSAFEGCTSLSKIDLPASLRAIGSLAFKSCTSLTAISVPPAVETIGDGAFYDCTALTEVSLPSSFKKITVSHNFYDIGGRIPLFEGCPSLTYRTDGVAYYLGNDKNPYLMLIKPKDTTITAIAIPEGTRFINDEAFAACTSLTSATLPSTLVDIGASAFLSCTDLTSIAIPPSVEWIGECAFYELRELHLSDIAAWCRIPQFGRIRKGGDMIFPYNPISGADLYLNGKLVTELVIPDGVTRIVDGAFSGCQSITSVVLSDTVASIGRSSFAACTNLASLTIGNSLTVVQRIAFENCPISSVHISDIAAFCRIEYYSAKDNPLYSTGASLYLDGELLTELVIPKEVPYIHHYTFAGCKSLRSLAFEEGSLCTIIGTEAFIETSLVSIMIPEDIWVIAISFNNCENLAEAIFADYEGWTDLNGTPISDFLRNPATAAAYLRESEDGCLKGFPLF